MATIEHDTPSASAEARHLQLSSSGEQAALRSASSPDCDLCLLPSPDSVSGDSVSAKLLAQCEVLDLSPELLSTELAAKLSGLPALKAARLTSNASDEPPRVATFPSSPTLVYLSAPETLLDLRPKAGDMGPFPVCSSETRRLVFNFLPGTDERPKYRPKGRRPDVDHVVCVLHDGAGDEAHFWINWAVRYEIETTVVLCGCEFDAKRAALGEQVDLHHIHVQVLSDEDHKAQVGEDAFAIETQHFLTPEEEATAAA